jgi:cytoskeletal protein RodZ
MISSSPDPTPAAVDPLTARTRVGDEEIASGEFFRQARQRRGLTLQQIAHSTKIPLRHLEALEHDDLAALPGGMYRRAHVRAYADAVGLDRRVALAWLDRALEEAAPRTDAAVQASVPPPVSASRRTRASMTGGLALTAAVIALAIWARPQPAAINIASSTSRVPLAASSDVAAPHAPGIVLASSGSTPDPASARPGGRNEPDTVPPVSTPQPPTESIDAPTGAASTVEPQLTVITEPAGARVTVNGIGWGVTPVTIRYLAPGPKRLRLTREGYHSEERLIQLEAGRATTTVRIPMRSED